VPATLTIPHECCEHLDVLDQLMDVVWDIGGAIVKWGPLATRRHDPNPDQVYVEVHGLPGRTQPLRKTGKTLNTAAWAVLQYEWCPPDDQPDDPA
jgi:hypothetical protein